MKPKRLTPKDQKRLAQAQSALSTGQHDEATRIFERLAENHRNHPAILMPLAQCYVARRRAAPAQKLLKRLVEHYTSHGPLMATVGRTYDQLRLTDLALEAYQLALRSGALTTAQQIKVRTSLASVCERLNNLEQAQTHITFLLEQDPDAPVFRFQSGLLALRRGEAVEAEASLRQAIEAGLPSPHLCARAGYELGRALDRQGRYDEAFDAIASAKAIDLPGVEQARGKSDWVASITDRLAHAVADPTFAGFAHPPDPDPCDRPILLITGHPRSGTTLLEQMLDSHSLVATADESSSLLQHVFQPLSGREGETLTCAQLLFEDVAQHKAHAARVSYIQQLARIAENDEPGHWLIDKNPEAVVMIPALQCAMPSGRVVVVLRDPRDVVLSCYMQHLSVNPVSVNYDTLASTAKKYARTMSLWLAMRAHLRVPWLEVRYEDVVTQPEKQVRRVLDFMGLDFEEAVLSHETHAKEKVVRSPTYHAVAKPVYQGAVGRWRNYAPQFAPVFETLAPFIEAFGYTF